MTGTFLSFYFYFFLKEKIQTSAFSEFTESFLQYLFYLILCKNLNIKLNYLKKLLIVFFLCYCSERALEAIRLSGLMMYSKIVRFSPSISTCANMPGRIFGLMGDFEKVEPVVFTQPS